MQTKHLCALIHHTIKDGVGTVKHVSVIPYCFTDRSNAVLFVDPFCYLCFKCICIINFGKPFLSKIVKFIADTMIRYLNSMLGLNLSYTKDFRNLTSMVT